MPRFDTLANWLRWQESLHPRKIDLGLERIAVVAGRMGLQRPGSTVVSVAGTNGKGSSVALLEAILLAAGYRVGSYTSPHLLRYNERIRINGREVTDAALCAAFARIDTARAGQSLSYFEFGTLAALDLLQQAALDVAILEVGLGGRLDAVNSVDPDVALVTAIGLDHLRWLGSDREAIGREKAGIFRPGKPAVCSDPAPPASLAATARDIGAPWYGLGTQYFRHDTAHGWCWQGPERRHDDLPPPALDGAHQRDNAAGVLMVTELLRAILPVKPAALRQGLTGASLPGRCQWLPGAVTTVLDVAHNPHSAARLLACLQARPCSGRTRLVLGMLEDKDVEGFAQVLDDAVDTWYLAGLDVERGLPVEQLHARMGAVFPRSGWCARPMWKPHCAAPGRTARPATGSSSAARFIPWRRPCRVEYSHALPATPDTGEASRIKMDQRLKQRLVGAIVLISLAVIFIPIILEGPDDEWSPRTQDMPEPPRVEYQAEVELPLPATLPEPTEAPEENTAQEPVELAIPEPPAAGADTEPPPAPPASEPAPAATAPVPAATEIAESWVIQVGSFSQQANARGLRDRLVKAGYTSRLQETKAGGTPAWRVLVGPYVSREQAERQRDRIGREQQLKGLVTRDQG